MNSIKYDNFTIYTNFVKKFRLRIELTQKKLADRIGVSRETISRIENCNQIPSVKLAYDIANELGCRVYDVFVFRKIVEL